MKPHLKGFGFHDRQRQLSQHLPGTGSRGGSRRCYGPLCLRRSLGHLAGERVGQLNISKRFSNLLRKFYSISMY